MSLSLWKVSPSLDEGLWEGYVVSVRWEMQIGATVTARTGFQESFA
jgi:hypothetical protein